MKTAIVYVSKTGNTEKAARFIKEGIQSTEGVEVRLMNLFSEETVDAEYLKDCSVVIFGTPTYNSSMAWQLKKWFDTDRSKLAGKLGGAFATANFIQGGLDLAISEVLHHMLVKGMVVYSSGTASGSPFIHLGPAAIAAEIEQNKVLFTTFGKRLADKAKELFEHQ